MSLANLGCGCFCWALPRSLFALFLCWMAKRISGWGICVSPFAVCVCCFLFCAFDLPSYMTTGVHVDVILTCFFSCKDRASERYRPHQRKKKHCQSLPKHHVIWNCLDVVVAGFRNMAWVGAPSECQQTFMAPKKGPKKGA